MEPENRIEPVLFIWIRTRKKTTCASISFIYTFEKPVW